LNIWKFFSKLIAPKTPMLTQTAGYRRTKFNYRKHFWANRRGGGFDEDITADNQDFLNKVLIDKYTIKDSPLKDGPWKKCEFDPNGV
jgi:hypothetical protein